MTENDVFQVGSEEDRRILDSDLADWLGFADSKAIQDIIVAEQSALRLYGAIYKYVVNVGPHSTTTGYLLNDDQAIALIIASRSPQSSLARELLLIILYCDDEVNCRFLEAHEVEEYDKDNSNVTFH